MTGGLAPEDASAPLGCALISMAVLAGSGFLALPFGRWPRVADRVGVGVLALGSVLGLAGVGLALGAATTPVLEAAWGLPAGRFALAIDPLSAAFLLPVLLVPLLAGWYGLGYWPALRERASAPRVRIFLGTLAAAMELAVLARDGVLFLLAFELMTLSAFFLVTTDDEKAEVRRAGWLYLVASHVSLMFLMSSFALLDALRGSFDLTPVPAGSLDAWGRTAVLLLGLVGFGIKAGLMPLHVWLPAAHAAAPSHVSAVLSGVVIKIGIYGLARLTALFTDPPLLWAMGLLVLGAASGIAGVAFAIGQHDLKRLLAYHSIENIGIIVMGLGLAMLGRWAGRTELMALGFACAVMHVWNHALFKSLLFLSAGSVVHALGTRELDHMGGLWRRMPWSGALFLLGALAICGLPPLNGFVSEFYLYQGALRALGDQSVAGGAFVAPVLATIGALACACFLKVFGTVFLGHARGHGEHAVHECPWSMRIPMLLLGVACLVLGVAPGLVGPVLASATGAWAAVDPGALRIELPFARIAALVLAALTVAGALTVALTRRAARTGARATTWDCGYAAPTARMQYTGSSLASGLVRLLAFLLRPLERVRRPVGLFPGRSAYAGQVDDPVLARLGEPLASGLAARFVGLRQRQTGRIQGYIFYVVATTLLLLAVVLPSLELLERFVLR